jgi:hypothetical protein
LFGVRASLAVEEIDKNQSEVILRSYCVSAVLKKKKTLIDLTLEISRKATDSELL